jgi:(p)ppGpp synthase/HD superfamily hydrolase
MDTEVEMMAAVLHDVVEDTDISIDDLRCRGIPEDALTAIDHLTRREGEDYFDFIERVKQNDVARKVKLADLEDNMDMGRIAQPTARDLARLEKYRRARRSLMD